MYSNLLKFRIRYSETDQMGYVYHGNYAQYFEMGRTEWLRDLGISYKEMEKNGIMLPVINLNMNYLQPAKYDDFLTLKTTLIKLPTAKIEFYYELFRENEILTTATATLVFVDTQKNKPIRAPKHLLEKLTNIK